MRITIIGAGIGGLTAAIALRRAGFEVHVFERAPRLSEVGAGITLWPNAMRILLALGAGEEVIARGRRAGTMEIQTPLGKTLMRNSPAALEKRLEAPSIALHRADLHAALAAAVPPELIHLGAECVSVAERQTAVEARFADGRTAESDLIVAADGIHSAVRRQIFPRVIPRYSGYTGWRGVTAHGLNEIVETWGCGARFGMVPIGGGKVYWFATLNSAAGVTMDAGESRDRLLATFGDWHEPIRELITSTPAESILHNDLIDLEPFAPWSSGRVVLLGDAAHATTPNLGQGACMAIESAVVLTEELTRCPPEEAIAAYEERRIPRTARITVESWRIGSMGQMESRAGCAMRDLIVRMTPASLMDRRMTDLIAMPI